MSRYDVLPEVWDLDADMHDLEGDSFPDFDEPRADLKSALLDAIRPGVTSGDLLAMILVLGLETGAVRSVLVDHLAAVEELSAERTGAKDRKWRASVTVVGLERLDSATVAKRLRRRLDDLLALLTVGARS